MKASARFLVIQVNYLGFRIQGLVQVWGKRVRAFLDPARLHELIKSQYFKYPGIEKAAFMLDPVRQKEAAQVRIELRLQFADSLGQRNLILQGSLLAYPAETKAECRCSLNENIAFSHDLLYVDVLL